MSFQPKIPPELSQKQKGILEEVLKSLNIPTDTIRKTIINEEKFQEILGSKKEIRSGK